MKLIATHDAREGRYLVQVELTREDMDYAYAHPRTSWIRQLLERLQVRGSKNSDTLFFLAELALRIEHDQRTNPLPGPRTEAPREGRGLPGGYGLPPGERALPPGGGEEVRSLGPGGEVEHAEAEGSTPD